MIRVHALASVIFLFASSVALSQDTPSNASWPAFRGTGDSQTSATNLPTSWSDDENIAWTAELPGYGQVSLLDVQPFVDLLISGDFQAEADINGDGIVNLLDVQPFVDLLSG